MKTTKSLIYLIALLVRLATVTLVQAAISEGAETVAVETEERQQNKEHRLFRAYWDNGFHLDSVSKPFRLKVGGRIHLDGALLFGEKRLEDAVGELDSDIELRRAWLDASGRILLDRLEYKVQFGGSGSDFGVGDNYLDLLNLRLLGNMRLGTFKEPFGLEEMTSSNDITFLERSLTNTFGSSRSVGIMAYDHLFSWRVALALGLFRGINDLEREDKDRAYDLTCRITALPWYEDNGNKLLHLGLAFSYRFPTNNEVRFRSRPEVHLAPWLVDTDVLAADEMSLVGAEAALVKGPTSLQTEVMYASLVTPDRANPKFSAFYLMATHFLTGEKRPYRSLSGTFGRVTPATRFLRDGGPGAWEVALRYSHLDLNGVNIHGGTLDDISVGVNWYLNSYSRLMWNYVFSHLAGEGDAHMLQMRYQLSF